MQCHQHGMQKSSDLWHSPHYQRWNHCCRKWCWHILWQNDWKLPKSFLSAARADIQYLRLHAQTHCQLQYYVKDAFGISVKYNEYTPEHPWYGVGQGTGDATIWWVALSHSLLTTYSPRQNYGCYPTQQAWSGSHKASMLSVMTHFLLMSPLLKIPIPP